MVWPTPAFCEINKQNPVDKNWTLHKLMTSSFRDAEVVSQPCDQIKGPKHLPTGALPQMTACCLAPLRVSCYWELAGNAPLTLPHLLSGSQWDSPQREFWWKLRGFYKGGLLPSHLLFPFPSCLSPPKRIDFTSDVIQEQHSKSFPLTASGAVVTCPSLLVCSLWPYLTRHRVVFAPL